MQTVNAAELTANDVLVPQGGKVLRVKAVRGAKHAAVDVTVRDRRGVRQVAFRANERVTVRRGA